MRNLLYKIASSLLLLIMAAGCHGDVNELDVTGGGSSDDPAKDNGLILSVDKNTIEANGEDFVTFSLTLDGEELTTDDSTLSSVYFKDEKSGQRLEKWATTFSAVKNGDYSFVATYKGRQSANSVRIKAINREKYEPYGQKIMVYDLTGTWCPACPSMVAALDNVDSEWKKNMIVLAVHTHGSSYDPYALGTQGNDLGQLMLTQFGGSGYPTCIYDLAYLDDTRTALGINSIVKGHLADYPATCGVKISSSSLEGNTLTINAALHSPAGGEYELGYAILQDNQRYTEGTLESGIYNDIVCAISKNFNQMTSDGRVSVAAGEEHTQTFTIENFPTSSTENLRVVVFALTRRDGKDIVDNANLCALGESVGYTPVDYYDGIPDDATDNEVVPEGTLRLFADRTTIKADGNDQVTFRVMYGSEDVSNGRTMYLVRKFNGEEVELTGGANTFTTTTPGTYTFKARYYKGGNIYSDNEVTILATDASSSGAQQFRHKLLGLQFTSVGCTYCPLLSTVLKLIQQEQPDRLIPISFHLHFNNMSDPMYISASELYYKELNGNGLPMFNLDMRDGEHMSNERAVIEQEMAKIIANYPPTCGVAITTSYVASTRKLTITPRIKSNTASAYRYSVFLVEDGIVTDSQAGATGSYTHNNVVRRVVTDNINGARFNGGEVLTPGEDTPLASPLTVTLDESWNVENMRVVVSAMNSVDGDSYTCNNSNECRVGSSIDYSLESDNEGGDDNGGSDDGGNNSGEVKYFNRHVAVFEFTGTTCAFCPAGYVYLKYLIEDFYSTDEVHILAFHDTNKDPMGIPLTHEIYNAFKLEAFPSFVVDMRDGFTDKTMLRGAIDTSFENYPAKCGLTMTSSCDSSGKGSVSVEVYASAADTYRLALYILEDGIVEPQLRDGNWVDDYTHHHVVRTMLSSIYEGDRLDTLAAGTTASKQYSFTLDSDWVADNCTLCALIIDGNGYVNNVAVCSLNGTTPYDYAK